MREHIRQLGWFALAAGMIAVGVGLGTLGLQEHSRAAELWAGIVTALGFLLIASIMFQIPTYLIRIARRPENRKAAIAVTPNMHDNQVNLTVTNKGKQSADFTAVVEDIDPTLPGNPAPPWTLPWHESQTRTRQIARNNHWSVNLGTGELKRHRDDDGLEGGISLKRLGDVDVRYDYDLHSGHGSLPHVDLAVRVSRESGENPNHVDHKFRFTFDSKSSGDGDLHYPRIKDITYRPARPGGLWSTIVAAVMAAFAVAAIPVSRVIPVGFTQVVIAAGSETVPFISSDSAQAAFRASKYRIEVNAIAYGNVEMISAAHRHRDDGFFASSEFAAVQLQRVMGERSKPIIFDSPLVIASTSVVAACLQQLGIVSQEQPGIWSIDFGAYENAVAQGVKWSVCNNSAKNRHGPILIRSTNPNCSNSGELYVALAAYVANNDNVVVSQRAATEIGHKIKSLIAEQGGQSTTTENLFQQYLTESLPMVAVYEAQYLWKKITDPRAMAGLVLMYPNPTIGSPHILLARDIKGSDVQDLLKNSQVLDNIAEDTFGWRIDIQARFAQIMMSRYKIEVPAQVYEDATAPEGSLLPDLISATKPASC